MRGYTMNKKENTNHHLPQWIGYKLFCYNNGLVEGNLRTLEKFIHKYYK